MEVTLLDAWHYYKQDVIILRLEVHNPTSEAKYLSANQIEPCIANAKFDPLLTQQGTKVLLPGQTDEKYLFIQGYAVDIDGAHFELHLPPRAPNSNRNNYPWAPKTSLRLPVPSPTAVTVWVSGSFSWSWEPPVIFLLYTAKVVKWAPKRETGVKIATPSSERVTQRREPEWPSPLCCPIPWLKAPLDLRET